MLGVWGIPWYSKAGRNMSDASESLCEHRIMSDNVRYEQHPTVLKAVLEYARLCDSSISQARIVALLS